MFSLQQKRDIADKVQQVLRETDHPELPATEIRFALHVDGAEPWSWADIRNNGAVPSPGVNPFNELHATAPELLTMLRQVLGLRGDPQREEYMNDERGERGYREALACCLHARALIARIENRTIEK